MIPPHATLTLEGEVLKLRCPAGTVSEDVRLDEVAVSKLRDWAGRHLALAKKDDAAGLLKLGAEMTEWLEGSTGNLSRVLEAGSSPMIVEFGVGKLDSSELARAFLDAPWELLALDGYHLALRPDVGLTVLRRIGKAQSPLPAAEHRLGVVFMAAAPRGADNLDYEAEEASILQATKHLGLDLIVEESGTLDLLAACVARDQPEVVQISCHGMLEPEPGLLLEDEIGDPDFVKATQLALRLAAHHPRLLFLSACETAESHPALDSLAQSLVRAGAQAVLGWAAPVLDHEAALFGSLLLRKLSEGLDLAQAFSSARMELAEHESLPESPDGSPASRDWHLARLYLDPKGSGVFAKAGGPQRLSGRGQAAKTFLDVKGQKVPVAGELEFVGRRRQVQTILREFRSTGAERHAGVFIHGMGRQGKSSLAARVARRLEHTHEVLVLFGRYNAAAVLNAFCERLSTPEITALVNEWLPRVEQEAAQLLPALTALLEGPCRQKTASTRPVLLIVDDFEQALIEKPAGPHRLRTPELVPALRSLLRAFQTAETDSRLLFTCRYEFTLPDDHGAEMTDLLLKVPLHGMSGREAQKQAFAKLRHHTALTKKQQQNLANLFERLDRITKAAQGNPGLQDLLHSLCLDDPSACDACLEQMEAYAQTGELPEEDQVRQFLENLAIESLLRLLTAPARELLRAATLFQLPVPVAVMQKLALAFGADVQAIARLLALGLWESYEDLHDPQERALALNALVKPLAGELSDEESTHLATATVETLFECWGAEAGASERGVLQNFELTSLGLLAHNARVLAASAANALGFLNQQFEYKIAAAWAIKVLVILNENGVKASVTLLRTSAERLAHVGEVKLARQVRSQALANVEQDTSVTEFDRGALALDHARDLVDQGCPDEALPYLEIAAKHAGSEKNRAVTLGDIARIRAARGEMDAALALHQEMRGIFESLGDNRAQAVNLGDIARIRAAKGEVDSALALHAERLEVNRSLGDQDGIASATFDIAKIELQRQQWKEAFEHLQESYSILLQLDRLDGICCVGVRLGQLLCAAGQREEGQAVLRRSLEGFQKLGWAREIAETEAILKKWEAAGPS